MDELWIIYALVFGAVLLSVQYLYWLFFRMRPQKKSINRRLALSKELSNPTAVLEALRSERGFSDFDYPILNQLRDFLVQTGLKLDRNVLGLTILALSVAFFLVLSLALGFNMGWLALAIIAAVGATFLFLRRARNRRIARFSEQLPDAIDVIVRGVKVGHPFSMALNLVAKEMPDPIGTEFGMTSDEIAFGLDVRTAIENLLRRVGQEDLPFLVMAINVQNQTGGNLAEILSRLSYLIRQRSKTRLKIKVLTAEGRLSAVFLSIIPFAIFGAVSVLAPAYFGAVRDHPATIPVLIFGLTSLAVGNAIIYRLVHFKF